MIPKQILTLVALCTLLVACGRSEYLSATPDGQAPLSCGNGIVNPGEYCDGANLNGETCQGLGFTSGDLACTSQCTFDTSDCDSTAPFCGNAILESGEQCDRGQLGGATCLSLGFQGGQLGCSDTCLYNTSNCIDDPHVCGDGVQQSDNGEECDGFDLGTQTCQTLGFDGGTLGCGADCAFDLSLCTMTTCGNSALDPNEDCDGNNLAGQTCQSLGWDGGTLACTNVCTFDPSGCTVDPCGNGIVSANEQCDGADLAGQTCQSLGFDAGPLSCSPFCTFDTSGCTTGTACSPTGGPLACGATAADNTSTSPNAADTMDVYNGAGCYSQWQMDGPEVVYSYNPGGSTEGVMIQLTGLSSDLDLIVLAEDGTGCSPDLACLEWSYGGGASDEQVVFQATANTTYYVVVDGFNGAESGYSVTFQCTGVEVCDDGVDNDGDGQTDCGDNDCDGDPACWTKQIWEQFPVNTPSDVWDLDETTVYFVPSAGVPNDYTWSVLSGVPSYPSPPGTGLVDSQVVAFSSANDSVRYDLPGAYTFTFFGQTYNEIYINTNGNITFGVGDFNANESEGALTNGAPRIAAHWDNLNPTQGGTITVDAFQDRLAITFHQVVDPFGGGATVSFQIELFWMGAVAITNVTHAGVDGIVGITEGGGGTGAPEVDFY